MNYTRITANERERIGLMLVQNKSYQQIGDELGRHKSTISREVNRQKWPRNEYSAQAAQRDCEQKAGMRHRERKLDQNTKLLKKVRTKLKQRWSPEQISRYLLKRYPGDKRMHISHETIYSYLYVLPRGELKKELISYLRRKHPKRRSGQRVVSGRGVIPEMISIEERPTEVAERSIPGHWEGDLIMGAGNRSAIGTLVERQTRLVFLIRLKAKDAESVRKAFGQTIKRLPQQIRKSLTYDQGKEMSEHKLLTMDTDMQVYFAHPHSPWERGTSENTNGLIRDYFPKGTDFSQISSRELKRVQHELNERPRKVLDWETPKDAMARILYGISNQ